MLARTISRPKNNVAVRSDLISYNGSMNIPSIKHSPTDDKHLAIGVIGLGAIGCLISSQLPSMATVYALPRHASDDYFSFQIQTAHSSLNNNQCYQWPIWNGQPLDIVIICCKANQCAQAIQQWHHAINSKTQIVLLQNGMGQHQQIANLYPSNAIFAASTTEGAFRTNANSITHAGKGFTQWGALNPTQHFKLPLHTLQGDHQWRDNIQQVLREKLAINAVINPLTVKFHCNNGRLLTQPEAHTALKALAQEISGLYQTLRWHLSFDVLERVTQICQLTTDNFSSMLQDINNHAPTEIDFINGYLLDEAAKINHKLPLSAQLIQQIKCQQ